MKNNSILSLYKRYGLIGFIRLIFDCITTRLFFKNVRIIRNPNYIRGKEYIKFGKNLTTGVGLRIDAFSLDMEDHNVTVDIGDNVELNDYVHIGAIESIKIGNNVLIASKVFITDHNHGCYSGDSQDSPYTTPADRKLCSKPVVIEDNVWIGENVTILPQSHIGKGCVVGSNSVVRGEFPDFCVIVGSPARIVKKYNSVSKTWEKV